MSFIKPPYCYFTISLLYKKQVGLTIIIAYEYELPEPQQSIFAEASTDMGSGSTVFSEALF
jgi:hypothetical protein